MNAPLCLMVQGRVSFYRNPVDTAARNRSLTCICPKTDTRRPSVGEAALSPLQIRKRQKCRFPDGRCIFMRFWRDADEWPVTFAASKKL